MRLVPLTLMGMAGVVALTPVYVGQGLDTPAALAAAATVAFPGVVFGRIAWCWAGKMQSVAQGSRLVLIHVAGAFVFSLAWSSTIYLIALLFHREGAWAFLKEGAVWQTFGGLLVYASIATSAQWSSARHKLMQQELAVVRAELHALRAQLDPHFVFNTLNALIQLSEEDPTATQAALERFADLLRHALNSSREAAMDVPLEDEIAFVRDYLALEKLRLGPRLHVVEEIDPEAYDLPIPALLLQPLVENAIRHAIAPRKQGGTLRLSASTEGKWLHLCVADDGPGIDPEAKPSPTGMGLANVRRRMTMRYAGDGDMKIETSRGTGVCVHLRLPAYSPLGGAPA